MAKMKENILRFANERGLDIRNLEKKAGLNTNFLSHIIRDKSTNPGIMSMIKLADALEISLDELAGRKRKYLRQTVNETLTAADKQILADVLEYVAATLRQQPEHIILNFDNIYDFIQELLEYCRESTCFDKRFADWLFKKNFVPF